MSAWRSGVVVVGLVAIAGCRERLTTAGCSTLCPPSQVQLVDTVLATSDVSDTSVRGYVLVREASYLLASSLDSLKSVILIRFSKRDSVWYPDTQDTAYVGTQDSVVLSMQILQRDTSVKQLRLLVYRLPARFDTAATYAAIQSYFVAANLVDTVAISDDSGAGTYQLMRIAHSLAIPAADSGVVSLGIAMVAAGKTAVTFASGNLGTSTPVLSYYAHARAPLDTLSHVFSVDQFLSLFVMSPPPGQPPAGVLSVGGIPTARATLHLSLPKVVVDSTAVVRATLLLNSTAAAGGFAHDTFTVIAQPVVRDFGVKSVLWPDSAISGSVRIAQGQNGPVELDIAPILRFWGTTVGDSTPRLVVLRVYPEGSILGAVEFAGRGAGPTGPQLRVTYVKPYRFGLP